MDRNLVGNHFATNTHWILSRAAETGSTSFLCQQPDFSLLSSFPPTGRRGWDEEQREGGKKGVKERREWRREGRGSYPTVTYDWLPGPHVCSELDWDSFSQHIPEFSLLKKNMLVT